MFDEQGGNLVFIFSPPRAGSTMLSLMLGSHSSIVGGPEPHVLVPLRFAGYFAHPEKADYDVINASLGLREFVGRLPDGEAGYVEACRRYASTLYAGSLADKSGAMYFMDKTPPNVLEWRFVTRLFPKAKYLALVRHPMAVLHSFAETYFMGDYALADREYGILSNYLPAMAAFQREAEVAKLTVCYETLVREPEVQAKRMLEFLGLPYEDAVVNYGQAEHVKGSVGDQVSAHQHDRPSTASVDRWITALANDPAKRQAAGRMIDAINDDDLTTYGYPKATLFAPLETSGSKGSAKRKFTFFHFKRRTYFALRWLVRKTCFGRVVRGLRYYCEVLLRE